MDAAVTTEPQGSPAGISAGATEELARFGTALQLADIPADVIATTKEHLLDQIGIQLACSELPWVRTAARYGARYARTGQATVLGTSLRLDAEAAAFVNGISGHAFEYDDSTTGASAHPGCVAVSSMLAMGEELDVSGADALVALTLAFETITRVGIAVSPSLLLHRGWHETCVEGVFGSAIGGSRLMGFDAERGVTALGIAGSHASGTTEYTQSGGDVKRLHAGLGAMGGIRAVRLAADGFTAPVAILEGKRGVIQAVCQEYNADAVSDDLGTVWEFGKRAALKPYCCAASIIAHIDAAKLALDQSGRTVADIASIRVGMDRKSLVHVGSIGPEPHDATGAQFSSEYSVALALVKGSSDFDTYLAALHSGFKDPEVSDLGQRISVHLDDECDDEYPKRWLGKVTLTFKDGTESLGRTYGKGSVMRPMTTEDVMQKYLGLATRRLTPETAHRVAERVEGLESLRSVRQLLAPLDAG